MFLINLNLFQILLNTTGNTFTQNNVHLPKNKQKIKISFNILVLRLEVVQKEALKLVLQQIADSMKPSQQPTNIKQIYNVFMYVFIIIYCKCTTLLINIQIFLH